MPRILDLILGTSTTQKIKNTNLLIIGVGGIGCELLKNLSKTGFKKFTILDLDIIQQTNLNRQFYFRKKHVGSSKSLIGRQSILQIDPTLQIVAICDNIFKTQYDVGFYSKFDIVISALDNVKARQYLAKMCMKAGKPLVDAGTQAYSGQTRSTVRYYSQCHNCRPAQAQQSFAVCTIRNRPQRPVHCVAYAKNFYDCFFGGDKTNALRGDINLQQFIDENLSEQQIKKVCIQVFNALFCTRVAQKNTQLMAKSQNGEAAQIRTLKYEEALEMDQILTNPTSTFNQAEDQKQKKSLYEQEKLWSIKKYAEKFYQALYNILTKQSNQLGNLKFQKDDQNCMMLVYCITTLRTYNFMNRVATTNKHKYLTYFQVKDIAGKIIAAIASTNAIAASTQIMEVIKIIKKQFKSLRYVTFNNSNQQKISGMELPNADLQCSSCSLKNFYLWIVCDFNKKTYRDLENFLKNYYSYKRDVMAKTNQGSNVTILSERAFSEVNRDKTIFQISNIVNNKSCVELQIQSIENHSKISLSIYLQHVQNEVDFSLKNLESKQQLRNNIKTYYRKKLQQKNRRLKYIYSDFEYK